MTIFTGYTCPITSCPANRGARGLTCGYIPYAKPCRHPTYKAAWAAAHELAEAQRAEAPQTLTARAIAATRPITPARARQLALEMETIR